MEEYKYTVDMTSSIRYSAPIVFQKFIGQPIRHLEIGVYEGLSGCFMLDTILTHPNARYVGIDPYEPEHFHALLTARENFKRHGNKVTLIPDFSYNTLEQLQEIGSEFDTIYIDGCHSYGGCKKDIEQSWPLLKPGGVILCDDYNRDDYGVRQATEEFLASLDPSTFTVVHKAYQIAWSKL